jgi:hypothetical protein
MAVFRESLMIVYLQNVLSLEKFNGQADQKSASRTMRPLRVPHLIDTTSRPRPSRGDRVNSLRRGSTERERKSLHARIEKLDLELSISDGLRLSDQLI